MKIKGGLIMDFVVNKGDLFEVYLLRKEISLIQVT